jgi:hypothetical protein
MYAGECGKILSLFSTRDPLNYIFRLSGLPADDIFDAFNKMGAEMEASEAIRCRCGCGEAVQPPNKAYMNKSHQSRHMQAS